MRVCECSARDEQRRILRESTCAMLAQRVREGGFLRIATDVEDYAAHAENVVLGFTESWKLASKVSSCHLKKECSG